MSAYYCTTVTDRHVILWDLIWAAYTQVACSYNIRRCLGNSDIIQGWNLITTYHLCNEESQGFRCMFCIVIKVMSLLHVSVYKGDNRWQIRANCHHIWNPGQWSKAFHLDAIIAEFRAYSKGFIPLGACVRYYILFNLKAQYTSIYHLCWFHLLINSLIYT